MAQEAVAAAGRRLIVYFHGLPGGRDECEVFRGARGTPDRFVCLERFRMAPGLTGEAFFRFIARTIDDLAAGEPVVLVGFSMGAFIALRTVPHLTSTVERLHLISAAGPLESGDFLPQMAGRSVFRLAQRSGWALALMAGLQGWLARVAPGALLRALFGDARGGDAVLARDPWFQSMIIRLMRSSLGPGRAGYVRELRAYVRPWAEIPPTVRCDVQVWHGALDNWTPLGMARRLSDLLPQSQPMVVFAAASHYSCLALAGAAILELER